MTAAFDRTKRLMQTRTTQAGDMTDRRRVRTAGAASQLVAAIAVLVAAALSSGPAAAQEGEAEPGTKAVPETIYDLPLAKDIPLPEAESLLVEPPYDWIYIDADDRGDRLLEIEPLAIRPDILGKVEERVDAAQAELLEAFRLQSKVEEKRAALEQARLIELNLVGDVFGFAYALDSREIKRIEYHEDLCLRRADALRRQGRIDTAWELVTHVRRRDANWPGLDDAINAIQFADAARLLADDQPERALAVLDQLYDRDPRYLNLETRYAEAVERLSLAAFDEQNYRRARYYLGRLEKTFPKSKTVGSLAERLEREALAVLDRGERASSGGDARAASELAREAAKIWPPLGGRKRVFERLTRAYPILHVGVLDCAEPASSPLVAGPANWRYDRLTTPRLFHQRAVDADLVRYGSDFVRDWQPEDLGRNVSLQLLGRQPRMQPQPITDAYQLADSLLAAAGDFDRYGDRYAATLLGVRPVRSDRLELALGVQPLRVQAFLSTIPMSGPGPFRTAEVTDELLLARQADRMVRFVREHRPDGIAGTIAEVVEHRMPDGDAMVRALRRAEVDMLADVPLYTATRLLDDISTRDQAIAGPCSLPETHILQFRPGGVLAATTELRRGLAVAMNRDEILQEVFLHDKSTPLARLTTSMMPQFSYAADNTLTLRTQDTFAATALGLVGRRKIDENQWGGWKMLCPSDSRSRDAAAKLAEQFRRAGFPVELVDEADRQAAIDTDNWELLYRRVQIAEPLVELWPTLALGQDARIGELTHLPETFRRRLLDLENVDDWTEATDLLRAIDRSIWASAIVIPLWELDRVTLRRRSLRDAPEPPLWPYDDLGNWRLEPQVEKTLD